MFKMQLFSLIFFFCSLELIASEEPQCSRFHYETQTLEKMIRTEIKVDAMEKEILKTNQLILDSLEDLKNEREIIVNYYAVAKKSLLDESEKLKSNYVEQENGISDEKEKLKQSIADLREDLLAETKVIKDSLLKPAITFKARHVTDTSLETDQTIIFSNTMQNEGGAYDNTTGIFTATVSGTYLFTTHFCVMNGKHLYYGIVCDNVANTNGYIYDGSNNMCYSGADAILNLQPGQKVWVKCTSSVAGDVLFQSDNDAKSWNYWNTFSGTLINK